LKMSTQHNDVRLVIKHTFIQIEGSMLRGELCGGAARCRAMTDTLIGYNLALKASKHQDAEADSDGTTTIGDSDVHHQECCQAFLEEDGIKRRDRRVKTSPHLICPPGKFFVDDGANKLDDKVCWADLSPSNNRMASTPQNDKTTLMFRHLPDDYVVDCFLALLDKEGFEGTYDFAYMPMDFQKQVAVGYAFVNFTSAQVAQCAWCHFDGFDTWDVSGCSKQCEVRWSNAQQGVSANVDRYRNSPVMHESVDDKHKPRLFVHGVRVAFPLPTEKIRPPKMRRSMKRPS